ncbi:hypothetical protein I0Q91_12465 [Halanaerobiaceae bacterium Z-7014]|uniref:Uncharacterized protein n=1 Tax=Halonatronomonas betaini TaxID=2778430 RepID=A0A931AWP1_9FIRM|nr:hypothetical protein [Halonatronomonas betaini]MBF8437900.1 hypothetical protein [Halonatronomonas betaini]
MSKFQKAVALSLVLALVVFAAAACGVPDEEEFEEMDDDFGIQIEEVEEELVSYELNEDIIENASIV